MTKDSNAITQALAGAAARLKAAAATVEACAPPGAAACAADEAIVQVDAKAIESALLTNQGAAALYREAKSLGSKALKKSVRPNQLRPWALEFTTWLNGEAKDQRIIQNLVLAVRG